MKKILLFSFLISFLKADYLYEYNDFETGQTVNICIASYVDSNSYCLLTHSNNSQSYAYSPCASINFEGGYTYDSLTTSCTKSLVSDASALGLTEEHYNLLMALTANGLGFTMVFLVGFLFTLQGRR